VSAQLSAAGVKSGSTTRQPQRVETVAGEADAVGEGSLLARRKLALICSRKCPGDVILNTYDFARLVRGSGIAIMSGFQSPIEKDCLPILLRGSGPVIIVQGHRLSVSRLPREWQDGIDAGRLLLLSPFNDKDKRVTTELAAKRNRFVAAISDEVLIPYAAPGSKTEALALDLLKSGKRVYTFSDRPGPLLAAGAQVVSPDFFSQWPHSAGQSIAFREEEDL
jgi:predicted Rossmann fold nucleotide-binding protein DprA/Smf involved in DNA uptake